jgi:hypothetical protein
MCMCVHYLHYDYLSLYDHLVSYARMSILLISMLELLHAFLRENINNDTLVILPGEMLQR